METQYERAACVFSYGLLQNAMSPVDVNSRHLLNTYFVVDTLLGCKVEETKIPSSRSSQTMKLFSTCNIVLFPLIPVIQADDK